MLFFMAFIDRISEGFRKSNVEHFCFQKFYTYSRPDAAVCCVVCMMFLHRAAMRGKSSLASSSCNMLFALTPPGNELEFLAYLPC